MDLPIKNGGSFHSYVSLPEGIIKYGDVLQHVPLNQRDSRHLRIVVSRISGPAAVWWYCSSGTQPVESSNGGIEVTLGKHPWPGLSIGSIRKLYAKKNTLSSLFLCTKLSKNIFPTMYCLDIFERPYILKGLAKRLCDLYCSKRQTKVNFQTARVWLVVPSHPVVGPASNSLNDHSGVNLRFGLQAVHLVNIDIGGPINTHKWDKCIQMQRSLRTILCSTTVLNRLTQKSPHLQLYHWWVLSRREY